MKDICKTKNCRKPRHSSNGLCGMHWARYARNGHTDLTRRPNGTGNINQDGYVDVSIGMRRTYEHIFVAEKALGKPLPDGALVHHINCNKSDNRPENLAIFPSDAYHKLIHRRMKASSGCGDPNMVYCSICNQYDRCENMYYDSYGRKQGHHECVKRRGRERYRESKKLREMR